MLSGNQKELAKLCKSLARAFVGKAMTPMGIQWRHIVTSSAYNARGLCIQGSPKGIALVTADHEEANPDSREASGNAAFFDEAEVSKFSAMAADWWDPRGSMAPLHSMNPTRVKFCRQAIADHFRRSLTEHRPLHGLKIADVGSGGGLLSESLARIGGSVTGVDASREAIAAAQIHARGDESLAGQLSYRHGTAESLDAKGTKFNAVVASEVIEHVPNPESFCRALASMSLPNSQPGHLSPGESSPGDSLSREEQKGMVVISTLNRTPRSYAMAVLAAERLLGVLPVGTHEWDKFITPEELVMMMEGNSMELDKIQGMSFNPFRQSWSLSDDLGVNYIAAFRHKS